MNRHRSVVAVIATILYASHAYCSDKGNDVVAQQSLVERSAQGFTYGKFQSSAFSEGNEITVTSWNSEEGKKRLFESENAKDFFQLANFYQPQISPVYCGVASAVIVMNALSQPNNKAPEQKSLEIPIPGSDRTINFPAYSQTTFLGTKTDVVKRKGVIEYRDKNKNGIYKPGLSLLELKGLIEAYQFRVSHYFPSEFKITDVAISDFRDLAKDVFSSNQQYMIIHFRSDMLGGIPKGHISPVAAYHEPSDSILILDVAGHKGPWYWAPVDHVLKAMATTYDTQPKGGGYLVISGLNE